MASNQSIEHVDTYRYILETAVPLFAAQGFSGVSMRDISKAVGISTAALYHHFSDKENLYLEVMRHAFKDKAVAISTTLEINGTPLQRLEHFINNFVILIESDPDFRALVQWELLNDDETRLKLLTEEVFFGPFQTIISLVEELATDNDPHMLTVSIIGLVLFHFETSPIRRFLPGGRPEHNDSKYIAKHVMQLLTKALSPS